jgi:PKD repeat protein
LTVTFNDSSSGTITNRFWDFGDGSTTNTSVTSISHTYTSAGTSTVSLTVTGPVGTNKLSRSSYITVTNPPPLLTVNPAALAFGSVNLGQSNTLNFKLVNNGGSTLIGTASATLPFLISSGSPFNVSPGQTGIVTVTFAPSSPGSFSNVVVFTSNGGNSTNTVTGTTLTAASLSVSPSGVDFGVVAVGGNSQISFTVSNLGQTAASNVLTYVDGGPFSILSPTTFNLAGLSTTNVTVQFAPPGFGLYSNNLIVAAGAVGTNSSTLLGSGAFAPGAAFTGSPSAGLSPLIVTFTDLSSGTITNRFWDFGDGTTTNTAATHFSHTYSAAGMSTVSLTVTGPLGTNNLTRVNYVLVTNPTPVLSISSLKLSGTNVVISFNSQAGSYYRVLYTDSLSNPVWLTAADFVPGTGGTVQAVHLGGAIGSRQRFYRVQLLTTSQLIPNAAFSASPTIGAPPLQVTFTDISSGYITNHFWNFGDGTTTNTAISSVTHTYAVAGSNTVSLTVSGPFGQSTQTRTNYIVTTTGFIITAINISGSNVVISFNSQAGKYYRVLYADSLTNPVWLTAVDFVAGNGSIVQAVHVGGAAGSRQRYYRVQLLTDSQVALSAAFTGSPLLGQPPLQVTFTDTSAGFITNRFWDFGDGSTTNTTSKTVSHTYAVTGTNSVRLTVSGPPGQSTLTRTNYVVLTDQLIITAINLIGTDVYISFTTQSGRYYRVLYTDSLTNPVWFTAVDFVPGTGGIIQVVHAGGASSSRQRFYRVELLNNSQLIPNAMFSASPTNGHAPLQVTFTDASTGYITSRAWDFGDGSTSNTLATVITHIYSTPGTNGVRLTVSGPIGSSTLLVPQMIVVTNSAFQPIKITSFQKTRTNVVVSVQSFVGVNYVLESTPTLTSPSWLPVGPAVPGTGTILQLIDSAPAGPTRFYRVRQL